MNNTTKLVDRKRSRRSMLKAMFTGVIAGGAGMFGFVHAKSEKTKEPTKKTGVVEFSGMQQPLISQFTVHENFVFVKGMGDHDETDIKKATTSVLDQIEEQLTEAGSSMEKALHVNVYLHNIRDYDAMNEAYRGRFGDTPPARSTVACYNGIPGNSLIEMDCIAAL